MKIKLLLLILLVWSCATISNADDKKDNYGTDENETLVAKANDFFSKGKYESARDLYEAVLASGDTYYAEKCAVQLTYIKNLLKKSNGAIFSISEDTVRINYLGGDYPIHVDGTNWKAAVHNNEEWCKIDVNHKNGKIKILCSKNESTSMRSTYITITNGNGKKKNVEIINDGSPEILRSSAQNLVFTPVGETNIVDIVANTDWYIDNVPTWLHAIKGNGDIQFTATPNDENKDRIAQVKVETPSKQEIIINIIQGATLDSLAFNKNNIHFGPDGGDEFIHVLTNAEDWKFGDFPHWCQLERVNDNTIKIHCTPNQAVGMPREASVNVTTGSQTLGVNVYQAPKPIIQVIPSDGIGGRKISFGFSAGYIYPMIDAKSSSAYTFSPVNYTLGNKDEQVGYSSSGGFSVSAFADIRLYKNLYLNAGLNFIYYKYKNGISGEMNWTIPQTTSYYLKGKALVNFNENYTMTTLDVPVMASYRIPVTNKSHLQLNLGPVLSFGLSSKLDFSGSANSGLMYKYKIINGQSTDQRYDNAIYESSLNYDGEFDLYSTKAKHRIMSSNGTNGQAYATSTFQASPYKRMNFGLRFGLGYEYMGISFNVSYQYMLTNLANEKYWDGDRWTIFGNCAGLMTGYSQRNNLLQVSIGYTFRY